MYFGFARAGGAYDGDEGVEGRFGRHLEGVVEGS